jgi:hypothetical protein
MATGARVPYVVPWQRMLIDGIDFSALDSRDGHGLSLQAVSCLVTIRSRTARQLPSLDERATTGRRQKPHTYAENVRERQRATSLRGTGSSSGARNSRRRCSSRRSTRAVWATVGLLHHLKPHRTNRVAPDRCRLSPGVRCIEGRLRTSYASVGIVLLRLAI